MIDLIMTGYFIYGLYYVGRHLDFDAVFEDRDPIGLVIVLFAWLTWPAVAGFNKRPKKDKP